MTEYVTEYIFQLPTKEQIVYTLKSEETNDKIRDSMAISTIADQYDISENDIIMIDTFE